MRRGIWAYLVLCTATVVAQTNVTNNNDGAANTVPVYMGHSTLGNSPISISGILTPLGVCRS